MSEEPTPMTKARALGALHRSGFRQQTLHAGFADMMGEHNPFVGLVKCEDCWRYDDVSPCSDCSVGAGDE